MAAAWAPFTSGALTTRAALFVGALGAAAIVALYRLRLRRRRVVVAFAPLWFGPTGDPHAPRRRLQLRHWLSLALALALFGALWLAALDPRPAALDPRGRSIVLLIDRSASMAATDEPGTRLGAAKRAARAIAGGLYPADRALVASFADDAAAESGFEADPRRLERALDAIVPRDGPADLPRALTFAAAVLRGRPRPTVVLISDGAFPADARRAAPLDPDGRPLDLRYVGVGRRSDNVSLLSLAARRLPADPETVETSLVVQSFRPVPSAAIVEISTGGQLAERLTLKLDARARRQVTLRELFAPGARLTARLVGGDDLPLDDRATATIPALPRRRVLRVGGSDLYLDGALLSLGRTVVIDRLPAAAADQALARAAAYDLVIFDGVTPATPPTAGRFLYFAPRGPGSPFAAPGQARPVRAPVLDPASVRREHPLLRQLDLTDVNIAQAQRLKPAPGDATLAASFGLPLVVARARPGLRVVALAFDPRRSDLPMRPAFPLLIANALAWTAGEAAETTAAPIAGGTTRAASASDTTPVPVLALGGRALRPPDRPAPHKHARVARWALLLAAALLLFDWVSYHRRWTT